MNYSDLIAGAGALVLALVAYDAVRTTLSASSSGPLTNLLTSRLWRLLLAIHRIRPSHRLLGGGGTWITLCLIGAWVVLSWLGWMLLFCSVPIAVTHSSTGLVADTLDRAYFIGYTLTTLGYGDLVPGGAIWKILATIASANGLLLFTLSITYALPIVSAATEKRQLALCIHAIGATPEEILEVTCGSGDFESLADQLQGLRTMIAGASQKHLAYPILHYFHSAEPVTSLPLALVRLDLALELLLAGKPALSPQVHSQIDSTQNVIEQFMATLRGAFIRPESTPPEIPEPEAAGRVLRIPAQKLQNAVADLGKLELLSAYIHDEGRAWSEVWVADRGSRTKPVEEY